MAIDVIVRFINASEKDAEVCLATVKDWMEYYDMRFFVPEVKIKLRDA